jgi:hypothetical protein
MSELRHIIMRFASWVFWDMDGVIPLGPLAPYVFGLTIWRWPHRVEPKE